MSQELKKFDPLLADLKKAVVPMLRMAVVDAPSKDLAFKALQTLKGYENRIEEVRKELKAPLLDLTRAIDARAKEVTAPLEEVKNQLNRTLVAYNDRIRREQEAERQRLEAERRENDRKAREAMEDARVISANAKVRAEEEARIAVEAKTRQAEIDAQRKALNTETVSGVRKIWKFRITDPHAVKVEFMVPDETAIGKTVRALGDKAKGVVGGIEVWAEETVASGAIAPPARRSLR